MKSYYDKRLYEFWYLCRKGFINESKTDNVKLMLKCHQRAPVETGDEDKVKASIN
jgi:hypothetical protein